MHSKKAITVLRREIGLSTFLAQANLIPRVFLFSNMAAEGEKTLTYSSLRQLLIGAFHMWTLIGLHLQKQRW